MGIKNYVIADELHAIFHAPHEHLEQHDSLTFRTNKENTEEIKDRIKKRLGRKNLPKSIHEWGK